MRRVVVSGLGSVNSLGFSAKDSFEAIVEGKCGIKRISSFDATNNSVQIAAEIEGFDPTCVMNPKDVKKADRFIQLGLKAAKECMQDAGFIDSDGKIDQKLLEEVNFDRFGISSSSGIGGLPAIEKSVLVLKEKGPKRLSPFFIPSSLANMLSGFISIDYMLKGPNLASVTACAAGTHAIIEAAKTVMLNGADRMLVVASEAAICEVGISGFASMKALCDKNDDPQGASRPFDRDRSGFVMGEGAGALLIEEYESAKRRGAKIYCELVGFGESGDANHITTPAPEGEGAYRAIKAALDMAKCDISYINAHGTSTKYNDMYETMAIKKAFGGSENSPMVSSIKGQIGHCLGAAGGIEAVMSILAMSNSIVPPTINYENADPDCDLDYVPNSAREASLDAIMSNSFGFGGTNAVVIFKKMK